MSDPLTSDHLCHLRRLTSMNNRGLRYVKQLLWLAFLGTENPVPNLGYTFFRPSVRLALKLPNHANFLSLRQTLFLCLVPA